MQRAVFVGLSHIEQQILPSRYILITMEKKFSSKIQHK